MREVGLDMMVSVFLDRLEREHKKAKDERYSDEYQERLSQAIARYCELAGAFAVSEFDRKLFADMFSDLDDETYIWAGLDALIQIYGKFARGALPLFSAKMVGQFLKEGGNEDVAIRVMADLTAGIERRILADTDFVSDEMKRLIPLLKQEGGVS